MMFVYLPASNVRGRVPVYLYKKHYCPLRMFLQGQLNGLFHELLTPANARK